MSREFPADDKDILWMPGLTAGYFFVEKETDCFRKKGRDVWKRYVG